MAGNVVLVSGLRGPMMKERRYLVIDPAAPGGFSWTSDLSTASTFSASEAKEYSVQKGIWPGLVHNWTKGFAPPP